MNNKPSFFGEHEMTLSALSKSKLNFKINSLEFNDIRKAKYLKQIISLILILAILNLPSGCFYYRVDTYKFLSPGIAKEASHPVRNVFLHLAGEEANVVELYNIQLRPDTIKGSIFKAELSPKYLKTDPNRISKYKRAKEEEYILDEVHIFVKEEISIPGDTKDKKLSIPLIAIEKIEIFNPAIGATVASWVFGALGLTIVGIVGIVLYILLTKNSCPIIYTYNGQYYDFLGEIYGGAIYPCLERHDYMPVPGIKPFDDFYQIKIANELKERQYINLAELIITEHPSNSKVIMDKYGAIQTLSSEKPPIKALSNSLKDHSFALSKIDSCQFLFDDKTEGTDLNNLIMTFDMPLNAERGKLVVHARNSFWGDYIYGEFTKLFGKNYNKFVERQNDVPASDHIKWMKDQGLVLMVYIETDQGWEFVDYFNMIGPLASRDIVLPFDLSKMNSDKLKIKLESGFMFWELDYAAMDFSENIPVEIHKLSPSIATDENGMDVSSFVSKDDDIYMEQLEVGNNAILRFKKPASTKEDLNSSLNKEVNHSVFFHAKGYYQPIRDYKGKPDIEYLKTFRRPGALSEFSKLKYNELSKKYNLVTTN